MLSHTQAKFTTSTNNQLLPANPLLLGKFFHDEEGILQLVLKFSNTRLEHSGLRGATTGIPPFICSVCG